MANQLTSAKKNLLKHLQTSGISNTEIEEHIAKLRLLNPMRNHILNQYLESLPEDDRRPARERIGQKTYEPFATIIILTVEGQPKLDIPKYLNAHEINLMVLNHYGTRPAGNWHNWEFDPS
jgi:hypothetical protein